MFVWAMGRGSWSWGNILTRNQRVFSMFFLSELWLGSGASQRQKFILAQKCGQNHKLKCPNMGACRYTADWAGSRA